MIKSDENQLEHSTFSLREIPTSKKDENTLDADDAKYLDKIKILELSTFIDEWEQEILFSDNGFFSLKGKDIKDKTKEYLRELEKFVDKKISDMAFSSDAAKKAALQIKKLKTENIKQQMLAHQEKELYEWEIQVYNNAIASSLNRAVSYKNDAVIVASEFSKCVNIINLISERQKWNSKIFKSKKEKFISFFYFSIINAFLDDKDITFVHLFEKYKKSLNDEHREKLQKAVDEMKTNIIAYNWAIEIFSYNLDETELEKEINDIKDSELESEVRKYISLLKKEKLSKEKLLKQDEIEKSWENITSLLDENPAKALLYTDRMQNASIQKAQKEYIKQITQKSYIQTDKKTYIEILKEILDDLPKFRERTLSEVKHLLSEKDFKFFEQIQNNPDEEYFKIFSDYKYLFERFEDAGIKSCDTQYDLILSFQNALEECKPDNSKFIDIEKKNKIIDAIFARRKTNKKGAK